MITATYISKDRPSYLKRSVQSLFAQTVKPEHIVITDCSDNREDMDKVIKELIDENIIPITYIWKTKEELSRSKGRSLGRQYVKTPLSISTESDILFPPNLVEECLNAFGKDLKKIYVQPCNSWEEESGNIIKTWGKTDAGFFQVYRIEDFDNIGGYNPFFIGWGYEDYDFSQRIKAFGCKHIVLPLYVVHMYHKPSYIGQNAEENNNEKNAILARKCRWDNMKKEWSIIEGGYGIYRNNYRNIDKKNSWSSCNKG
jgi:GT2 family glycosyltransferase